MSMSTVDLYSASPRPPLTEQTIYGPVWLGDLVSPWNARHSSCDWGSCPASLDCWCYRAPSSPRAGSHLQAHARTVRPSSQWLYRCNASATRLRPSCNFPATFARPPFDARKLHDRTWVVRRSNLSRVAVITAAQRDNSLVHHRPLERRPVPRGKFPAVFFRGYP